MIIKDKNNKFLFGLSNTPKDKIYKIRVDKIKTRKRSLRINRKPLLDKHFINKFQNDANLKIIVEINYKQLIKNINNNNYFPCKQEIVKILRRGLKQNINYNDYVIDLISKINYFHEYTWYLNRENNEETINYTPYYIYNMKDLYINLHENTYTKNILKYNKQILLRGGVILNNINNNIDIIIKLIKNNSNDKKQTLIITNNLELWNRKLKEITKYIVNNNNNNNYNNVSVILLHKNNLKDCKKIIKTTFTRIIFDDCINGKSCLPDLKKFKSTIKWYISSKSFLLKYNDLVNIYELIFSYNLTCYDLSLIKKTSHCFIFYDKFKNLKLNLKKVQIELTDDEKNFYKKYCQNDDPNIYFSLPLNKTNTRFIRNKNINNNINNYDDKCCICLSKISENNKGMTECKHFFCYSCIYKYVSNSLKCPICRNSLKVNTIYKIYNDNYIKYEKFPSKIKYLLDILKKKKNVIIISKYDNSIKSLEIFFQDLNIQYKNVNDKKYKDKNQDLLLSTYKTLENIENIEQIDSKDVILMEPLNYNNKEYYYKSLIKNIFNLNNISYLASKNTHEDFI